MSFILNDYFISTCVLSGVNQLMQTKAKISTIYLNYSVADDYLISPFVELLDKMSEYHKQQYTKSTVYPHHILSQQHLISQVDMLYLADYFIVFWSKNSANDSRIIENCQKSANANQTIVFILLDKTTLPQDITNYKVINLMPFVEKRDNYRQVSQRKYFVYYPLVGLFLLTILLLTLPMLAPFIAMALVLSAILAFALYLLKLAFVMGQLSDFTSFGDIEYFMVRFYGAIFLDVVDKDEVRELLYALSDETEENAVAIDASTVGNDNDSSALSHSSYDGGSSGGGGDGGG